MQEPKISVIECPCCKNYMSIPDYYCYKCRVQWYQDGTNQMVKIPAAQMQLQLQELQRRLSEGQTDREIMTELKLTKPMFYGYKARL